MADRYLIMPAADLAVFSRIKFATSKKSKGSHNVRWEIEPVPLKGRTEYAIPESVVNHPVFRAVKSRLQGYTIESLEESALDLPAEDLS